MSAQPAPIPRRSTAPGHPAGGFLFRASLAARRRAFLALAAGLVAGLLALMVATLSRGGFDAMDLALTALFAVTVPWTVIGFLNAFVGLAVLRTAGDPQTAVCPAVQPPPGTALRSSTAIAVCIRNEDPHAVARNLEHMLAGLQRAGASRHFHAWLLSDSNEPAIAAEEARVFRDVAARWRGTLPVRYRRRASNDGFKAGNIRDFVEGHGRRHAFMLVLDADSFMTADAILRLVRIMEANPRIGILQSLINGLPAASAFARVFQYGMRLGMRSYTLGSAWWQGDCGPYWGHNALVRIAPFREHCALAPIPGRGVLRGDILSHDQVEAVLMRRAGYEVRVLPDAAGSYEENPPSLVEFVRRDLRWCLGNLQYLHLLRTPGLEPVSRVQLALAILMFAGSPAWLAFVALGALRVGLAEDPASTFDPQLGVALFASVLTMVFAPRIATVIDLLLDRAQRRAFGGAPRVIANVLGEMLFSTLLAPVMAIAHSRFIAGLLAGRSVTWAAQRRGAHRVGLADAWRRFWPQTLAGALALAFIAGWSAAPVWSVLPIALGPLLAVPLAMFTASATAARWLARAGLWRVPEEADPPPDLAALMLADDAPRPAHVRSAAAGAAPPAPALACARQVPALAAQAAK